MTPATIGEMLRRAEQHQGPLAEDVRALVELVGLLWPLASEGLEVRAAVGGWGVNLPETLRQALEQHQHLPEDLAVEPRCARCAGVATGLCEPCTRAVWGDVPCGEGAAPRRPR